MIKKCHIAGIFFTIIFGSLLHFTYEFFDYNYFAGFFSAVNESIWEHLKLIFFPMLIWSIFEYIIYGKNMNNFIPAKVISIVFGMLLIMNIFYTYTGIAGTNYLWADILTFVVSVILSYALSFLLLHTLLFSSKFANILSLIIILGLYASFILFTYNPPPLGVFQIPL